MKKILLFFILFFSFSFSVFAETYDTYILNSDLNKISNFEYDNFINYLEENKTSNSQIASAKKLIDNDTYILKFNPSLNMLFLFEIKDYSSLNSIDFSNTSCAAGSNNFCNIGYNILSRYMFNYNNSTGSFSYYNTITVTDDFFTWKVVENNVIKSSLLVYSSYPFKLVQNLNFSDGTTYLEKDKIYQGVMPLFGENQQKFYTLKFNVPKDSILILRDSNNNIIENVDNSFDLDSLKMRFDFNPNKITEDGKKFFNFLISFITDIHYTRLDLAIDLFNYDISSYNIIDIGSRKNAYFYDRVGKLETFYSGSMKSNKYIRIYNKAVEQKLDKNIDWWRFEIQLRDVYIDKYLNELIEFYKDILVFKYNSVDYYSFEENAILDYLLHDISRFEKLSKNQKTKYRKIIRSLELSSLDFFDTILSLTNKKIYDFLNFISFNNLYPEINSKIHLEYFE